MAARLIVVRIPPAAGACGAKAADEHVVAKGCSNGDAASKRLSRNPRLDAKLSKIVRLITLVWIIQGQGRPAAPAAGGPMCTVQAHAATELHAQAPLPSHTHITNFLCTHITHTVQHTHAHYRSYRRSRNCRRL